MTKTFQKKLENLLRDGQLDIVKQEFLHLDFHEIADFINNIKKKSEKVTAFLLLSPEIQSQVILKLKEFTKRTIMPELSVIQVASFLHFNDEDDATDILQYLNESKQEKILSKIAESKRLKIEKLLQFPKDTAGGLMDLNFVIVKDTFTFNDIAEKVQNHIEKEKTVPIVIITDQLGKAKGHIPHKNLLFAGPQTPLKILTRPLPIIKYSANSNNLIKTIRKSSQDILGVTDKDGVILGIIHIRDLLSLIESETTKNIFSFAGVNQEEDINDSISRKVTMRYRWLLLNLCTAFLAAFVVSLFEDTISKLAILAVFMPIVASEGGNAATQSLAVAIRGISTGEISFTSAKSIIIKESMAGVINGVITGVFAMIIAYLLNAPVELGFILAISLIVNLFVAGLFGAITPFVLKYLRIDPAVSSSVFVTTATDIVGFFVFLGLGAIILL
jgi:magnesium transporter